MVELHSSKKKKEERNVVGPGSVWGLKLLSSEGLPSGTYLENSSTKLQNWFI